MRRYVRCVSKSCRDLLARELVLGRQFVDRLTTGECTKDRGDIDAGPSDAWLSEPDFWVHRNAGIDFHLQLSCRQSIIRAAFCRRSFVARNSSAAGRLRPFGAIAPNAQEEVRALPRSIQVCEQLLQALDRIDQFEQHLLQRDVHRQSARYSVRDD